MAWPIVSASTSADVEVIPNPMGGAVPCVEITGPITTTMWSGVLGTRFGGITFPHTRNIDMEVMPDHSLITPQVFDMDADLVHHFAGIGGLIYIPRVPQLSRLVTAWPHAT